MRSPLSTLAIGFLVVAAVTVMAATPAIASTALSGGGTLQLGPPTPIWEHALGSELLTYEDGSLGFGGTIAGSGTIYVLAAVNASGAETFVAHWSAVSTIDGQSGVVNISLYGTDNGIYSGTMVAYGTGKLAGFVGEGRFTGQDATGAGTYTLSYLER